MRKGFTLIELLAVIVILAIIALIATPIILGIINDAREESEKRSVENYAHAVELAIAREATKKGGVIETGTYTIDFESKGKKIISPSDNQIKVDYKGESITDGTIIVLSEEGKQGQIELSEISFNGGKTKYNYSQKNGVESAKEKEISEEKDLAMIWYMYNTMYSENQIGLIENFFNDSNNDKKSDLNPELNAYLENATFNIRTSEFSESIPTSGNIKAVLTHYDGSEEEIILTTTDNKLWKYAYAAGSFFGEQIANEIKFRPYTKDYCDDNYIYCQTNLEYSYLDMGHIWIPFSKITILGKTIEFPVNKQALMIAGNIATETTESMYNDIDKVSKIIVNYNDGTKKEYKRNQMYHADEYLSENNDFYSSPNIPVLYTTEETKATFNGVKSFIINISYIDIEEPIESIIVEENGILTKYNVIDGTMLLHYYQGS